MLLSGKKCAEASKEGLHRDYCQRFPQMKGGMAVPCAFAAVQPCAAAIEEAGSVDVGAVRAVFDDPDLRFLHFGLESELGGLETFGYRCVPSIQIPISRIENGQVVRQKGGSNGS